jgi:hypothetical protein
MAALVCLTIALICAIISRVLLFIAAVNISIWWALGVFLPFGPLLFRLNYPDEARKSFYFRLGTLICVFLYFVLGPGAFVSPLHKKRSTVTAAQKGYASEFASKIFHSLSSDKKVDGRNLDQRRADNEREFERLNRWNESLQVRKRGLLRSDVEGNQAYNIDLQEYMAALAAATAEKAALAKASATK